MNPPEIPQGTNVVGVGIDQIEVSRIRESLEKHGDHFLNKIFSVGEQNYCKDKADPAPCLAARFAAKEASARSLVGSIQKYPTEVRENRFFPLTGMPLLYSKKKEQTEH